MNMIMVVFRMERNSPLRKNLPGLLQEKKRRSQEEKVQRDNRPSDEEFLHPKTNSPKKDRNPMKSFFTEEKSEKLGEFS